MDWLLPILVMSNVPRAMRAAVAEQILTVALPAPASQRVALAAIGAARRVRREAGVERGILEAAVEAAGFEEPADLVKYPALQAAFERLPATVQAEIFSKAKRKAKEERR